MNKRKFRLPSPALVISMITLSLVLGGTAFAASTARHSKHADAKADTKLIKKLAPKLSVKHAKTANTANHANTADTADTATNATTADNATNLGGQPASAYVPSSALQKGTSIMSQGTTGKVLFTNGPLSVTADCALSGGVTTVTVHVVSTVDNWLDFQTREATAGSVVNDSRSDSSTPGNYFGSTDRIDITAPSGAAIRGQDAFGVNWPSAGQCYVSAWVVAI
jgi:hypothetical protein